MIFLHGRKKSKHLKHITMESATQDLTKQSNQFNQGNQPGQGNQGMNKRKDQNKEGQNREGKVAREIETQTSKVPSDVYLWTSVAVMAASLTLKLLRKDHTALFIGQWAAPILLAGLYNKVVKTVGHDMADAGA
jgi:hypothetical protein